MKSIDWNTMSELGLIRRINTEVLHPLGLAMSRTPETGHSESILISDDGIWEYADVCVPDSNEETKIKIKALISDE